MEKHIDAKLLKDIVFQGRKFLLLKVKKHANGSKLTITNIESTSAALTTMVF